eukprot:TRINITY_DN1427_c0_g2_i3.p1 TRINITY_DN1427_c0_g2~~TRINITY_DN1427_c0_g2_i3.p1  ORF type:complete len:132 (-),score=35.47 TRINITY_DN1427_c0_g2_i3:27-422(-)
MMKILSGSSASDYLEIVDLFSVDHRPQFRWKKDRWKLAFYVSQCPCGDASIFEIAEEPVTLAPIMKSSIWQSHPAMVGVDGDADDDSQHPHCKRRKRVDKITIDLQRTGAKPVPGEDDDLVRLHTWLDPLS